MGDILTELRWRELIQQMTDEEGTAKLLAAGRQTVYAGFDPTADSLHVGSLLPLMLLRRFQHAGHRPIALVGGATGMIGDPSGKSEERKLLDRDQLAANVAGVQQQMEKLLDFGGAHGALLVNNFDWMGSWSYIDFLRDVGKLFPMGVMLGKDSVRSRLERSDVGLSYTEFSYMMLQAYDFVHLSREYDCRLQIGGSDQWGNITAGIDLGRRMLGTQLFGMTAPLLLTTDGRKMGKTETGTVWLSSQKTSPYAFYQYWIKVADDDVLRCIRYLTEIPHEEYLTLATEVAQDPSKRTAQKRLAEAVTRLIHGETGLAAAQKATETLFGGSLEGLSEQELLEIFADVPGGEISRGALAGEGLWVVDALRESTLCTSGGEARRAVQEGSVFVNNVRVESVDHRLTESDLAGRSVIVLRRGKKKYALIRFGREV
jgi:tyrosyl-tRNA synthetase